MIPISREINRSISQTTKIDVDCDNQILFTTHSKVPYVQVYDLKNKQRIARINTVPPSFRLSDEFIGVIRDVSRMSEFVTEEQSIFSFVFHTDQFIVVPFRRSSDAFRKSRDYQDRTHHLAVYSRDDYRFIGEIPVDTVPLGYTREGYLISLVDDNRNNFRLQLSEVIISETY